MGRLTLLLILALGTASLNDLTAQDLTVSLFGADDAIGDGETTTVTVMVTLAGVPQSGLTVTFRSSDPSVASILPLAVKTESDGTATATLRGVSKGTATVFATADGTTVSIPVRVPSMSTFGLILVALALMLTGLYRTRPMAASR